ncbi:hypothetical protein U737_18340 [Methylomonas sp. LW13]|uniref:hypothetical protein n=2 Tax=Methylomonas TaxID=416 RepID=UPI00051C0840|nr:hypothetical protein [Methylomonas sp. Kb3]QBC28708.1 hypothetical protein U737_18340 [Methylomonas sp. LW13]
MIFRSFPFALILMALLSIFFTNVVAMGIQAELVVDGVNVKDDKEKTQTAPDGVKDILSSVDLKKDIAKIHSHEIAVQNIRAKVSPDELAVDDSSISRPIFRQQENINKPAQFSFFVPDFSDADLVRGRGGYNYSDDVFSSKKLLDELRDSLGEGIYSKLVWTYYDLKDLDSRIYASMVGYDLSGSNLLGKLQQFIGVDENLNAMIVFKSSIGITPKPEGAGDRINQDSGRNSKVILDFSQRNFARKEEVDTGRLQYILKYLTIKNFVYSLLALMGFGSVWRMFRFFVKQDLR